MSIIKPLTFDFSSLTKRYRNAAVMWEGNMPKIGALYVLGISQLLLTVGLGLLIWQQNARLETLETAARDQALFNSPASTVSPIAQNAAQSESLSGQSLDLIRQIIREEIASARDGTARSPAGSGRAADMRAPSEIAALKSRADGQIQGLIAQGSASAVEMETTFGIIAKLPPAEREAAMNELNRAINNGQIQTRF